MHVILNIILECLAIGVILKFVTRKSLPGEDIVRLVLVIGSVLFVSRLLSPEACNDFDFCDTGHSWPHPYLMHKPYAANVEAFDEDARFTRENNVLYSGDLVNIKGAEAGKTDNLFLQRNLTSSEILLHTPLDGIHTNLSKLRFELLDHDNLMTKPIKYGDTVYIKHNANINNLNSSRFIKISDNLLSHQEGPLFNQFQIFNAASPSDTSNVKPDTPIVIKTLKSGGIPEGFLKLGTDNKFTNQATTSSDATQLTINLQRVVELNDKHLSIEENTTLFP